MTDDRWPALPYRAWADTYQTLHLWMQVVGKIALATAPPLNHSWGIALQIMPRGLTTRRLLHGDRSFVIEFDFIDHQLAVRLSDGQVRMLPLQPRPVADFYRELMALMRELGIDVRIWPVAVELPTPIRLDADTEHSAYDRDWVDRWWRIVVQVEQILTQSRCGFVGKASPAHFFWGAFDLALTRFSGRLAPGREGPGFMVEAYSHEVISHGFWPGGASFPEPAFYAYAVPEPAGLKDAAVQPDAAYYHRELGEFILPYDAVRTSASPDRDIRAFIDSTYQQAAALAKWDRTVLERT